MGERGYSLLAIGCLASCVPVPDPKPEPKPDPGERDDRLEATIDDMVWQSDNVLSVRDGDGFIIQGSSSYDAARDISLRLIVLADRTGTYHVEEQSVVCDLDINNDAWSTDEDGRGTVTVTSFSVSEIKGTFDLTLRLGSLERHIADGAFSINFSR